MTAHELQLVLARIAKRAFFFDADQNETELVEVNQRSWAGDYPLHIAAMLGDVYEVEVLLQNGALIDARGEKSMTPLNYAAMKNHEDVARALVRKGANPNLADTDGRKPSAWAKTAGYGNLASMLTAAEKSFGRPDHRSEDV